MSGCRHNGFKDLGVGIGLRVPHYEQIIEERPDIDWFEIISENFMVGGGRPLEILDSVLETYPVVQHGVSLYFGSLEPFDSKQLELLKALSQRTRTPFVSDHLCWGSYDGAHSHDLLPLPYTKAAVKNTADRIAYVQDFLELPVCVENVSSYLTYKDSEMTEWEFLSEVVERADCGILLDLNNVFVSSVNHGFEPMEYLRSLPLERVGQIHLAGHSKMDSYLLDTHDHPVCDEVWDLYRWLVSEIGPVNTLLEWDARIPTFDEVRAEAWKAREIIKEACHDRTIR